MANLPGGVKRLPAKLFAFRQFLVLGTWRLRFCRQLAETAQRKRRLVFILLEITVLVFGLTLQSKDGSSISTAYSWRKLNNFKDTMILKLLLLVIPRLLIKSYSNRKLLLHKPLINF